MPWFNYSIIQYAGDPVRQEGVNLGVAVFAIDSGESRLLVDGKSFRHIQRLWPDADLQVFRAFLRDLSGELGSTHQTILGEAPRTPHVVGPRHVEDLRARHVNQFRITPTSRWRGSDLVRVSRDLFERFVDRPRVVRPRRRHMTRADLRNLVSEIFSTWARDRANVVIEVDSVIDGARAPHVADVIVLDGDRPRLAAVAVPTEGAGREWASLLRDSLPSVVSDVRERYPDIEFFAVFPDLPGDEPAAMHLSPEAFRAYLAGVEGLRVARLGDLRREFEGQSALRA